MVSIVVQTTDPQYNKIILNNVLHFPKNFTNLISASSLHQNSFYFHGERQKVNQIKNDLEISAALIKNRFYILNTIYRPLIADLVKTSTSLNLWHWQLSHPSWANLKRWAILEESILAKWNLIRFCSFVKFAFRESRKELPPYKLQTSSDNICDEIYVDFMGSIPSSAWNRIKYSLTVTNSFSLCQ